MTTLESVEAELAAADEAREVQREVVRHLVSQVSALTAERDRALACEAAALGLLREVTALIPAPYDGGSCEHAYDSDDLDEPCPFEECEDRRNRDLLDRVNRALEVKP